MYLDWVARQPRAGRQADRRARRLSARARHGRGRASASSSSGTTAQIRKEGLVVDVRANGGGNVSRMLIERLRRELLGVGLLAAPTTRPTPYPDGVFIGPMAAHPRTRTRRRTATSSPTMFRQAGLGPLIGQAVVGRRGRHHRPRTAHRRRRRLRARVRVSPTPKGEWVIEGYGVDPDIEVENDPKSVIAGQGSAARARGRRGDEEAPGEAGEASAEAGGPGEDREEVEASTQRTDDGHGVSGRSRRAASVSVQEPA